jgi:GTP-binding protein
MRRTDIRNIAIIAHVDHGKTTLVDCLLKQSGEFRSGQLQGEQILDSNDQERERGITILAKNIALHYKGTKINIIDTPGHADFGGEVERVLRMADGCLVLVDAAEGPMPQTRFVLTKALEEGLQPIVVINKIDRPDARAKEVLNEVYSLFIELGGSDELLESPHIYASARGGYASHDPDAREGSIEPLVDLIIDHIPGPMVDVDESTAVLVTTLDWSDYLGRIGIGRIRSGSIKKYQTVAMMRADGSKDIGRINGVYTFDRLGRTEVEEATAGDIVAVAGLDDIKIGDTLTDPDKPRTLARVTIDEPTLRMTFGINTSPLSGRDGKFLTIRHIRDRLARELERNVALRVEPIAGSDSLAVSGRGLLHLSVLIETMRREGFELSIGKPTVIVRENNGVREEPFEELVVEVETDKVGPVMELVGARRGQIRSMSARGDRTLLIFRIPARGLIGLKTRVLNSTAGTAIMTHRFEAYDVVDAEIPGRANGVLVSQDNGKATPFALFALQARADLFVAPGDDIYEGMIVGENSRDNDLVVNPIREKKLTNMRASGRDENVILKPPRDLSLEKALEYIQDDELVEVTPKTIRLRKILLSENDRKRENRRVAAKV